MSAAMQGLRWYWNQYRVRDFGNQNNDWGNYGYYSYWGSSNRNAGNIWPLVLEYDEPIAVDSFEYYRGWYPGNGNSSAQVSIDYWDSAANEGAGGWVEHHVAALVENGATTTIQYTEIPEIVAQKFRLRFGDTNSSTLHMSWIRLMSSVPPIIATDTSVDLTWGLMIPFDRYFGSFGTHFWEANRSSLYNDEACRLWRQNVDGTVADPDPEVYRIPSLLLDVGGPHSQDKAVQLTKAENIGQGEVPELLNLILEFTN